MTEPSLGMNVSIRPYFATFDIEYSTCLLNTFPFPLVTKADKVNLLDNTTFVSSMFGNHSGNNWGPWVSLTPFTSGGVLIGQLTTQMQTDWCNWSPGVHRTTCPTSSCGSNYAYSGVSLRRFQYRRFESGATPIWTPLRFPGQYYDSETDLHQNGYRTYDPESGRFTAQEPLLRNPRFAAAYAYMGHAVPSYAYAGNNPVKYVDLNGKYFVYDGSGSYPAGLLENYVDGLARDPNIGQMIRELRDDPDYKVQIAYESEINASSYTMLRFDGAHIKLRDEGMNDAISCRGRGGLKTDVRTSLAHELGHVWADYSGQNAVSDWLAVAFENFVRNPGPRIDPTAAPSPQGNRPFHSPPETRPVSFP
jgi:RHS repeat-associated protein